ncbi:unnamed protein product [Coffea canephora]|uniref:Uncharacterized protein n=1 Tax=Coffea canephora TaxID=49390 RepID=A0A068V5H6_COFCA|nr:unnamed protein product [Coffea canephora]
MLRLLSSYSLLTCDVVEVAGERAGGETDVGYVRVYGLSPVAEYFVPDEEGNSVAPAMELLQDKVLIDSWRGWTGFKKEEGEGDLNPEPLIPWCLNLSC